MPRRLPVLEAPRDHVDELGRVWRRFGFCSRCGACCKSGNPFPEEQGQVPGACSKYVEENGVGGCSDRTPSNRVYQAGCINWPTHPHQIVDYEKCTYRIEQVT